MKSKKPLISVIIPVYNAAKYLEDCIDSVIGQSIGFVDHIELVLVNDGSVDDSDSICRRYFEEYPDNVSYIKQKNGGVSNARNTGLKAANGDFVSFIDADDYISLDAMKGLIDYFKDAPEDVNVAICRVIQFGSKNRERPINKKFNMGTRTADLNKPDWYDVYPRVAPSMIRASAAKKYTFCEDISFYEDTRYTGEILSETMTLGVVDEGIYYNRKHDINDIGASITTGATSKARFYQDSSENVSLYLLKKTKGNNEYPPLYFQYLALYEMRWRLFYNPHDPMDVLSRSDYKVYCNVNKSILSLISDEAIVAFKLYNVHQRVYTLNLKHNTDVLKEAVFADNNKLLWNGLVIFNHMKKLAIEITNLHAQGSELIIEGFYKGFIVDDIQVHVRVDGENIYDCIDLTHSNKEKYTAHYDSDTYNRTSYVARIPISDRNSVNIDFGFTINNTEYLVNRIDTPLIEGFVRRIPKFSKIDNYTIVWHRQVFTLLPTRNRLVYSKLMISVMMRYMIKYTRKGIGRILRIGRKLSYVHR